VERLAKKLMSWASILEDGTREQALRTASLPFIHPWVALMPDAHLGRGATIGSVIPTLGAIIPAAVGVDIGCGMIAVRSQFTAQDVRVRGDLAVLREAIEAAIPLSAGQYNADVHDAATQRRIADLEERAGADSAEMTSPNWRLQLGSLARGTISSRSAWTRRTASGCSCTLGRAGSGTGWRASTSRSPRIWPSAGGSRCPTPTWPT